MKCLGSLLLLAPVATAVHVRGTGSAQTPVKVVKESATLSARGLEDSLMELLANGNTPGLKAFVDQIGSLIGTQMKPKVVANRDVTQAQLNKASDAFAKCSAFSSAADVVNARSQFAQLAGAHTSCRAQQAEAANKVDDCKKDLDTSRALQTATCTAFTDMEKLKVTDPSSCPASANENYGQMATRLGKYFTAQAQAYQDRKKACDDATAAAMRQANTCRDLQGGLDSKKATCDQAQETMDSASCSIVTATKAACSQGDNCYSDATTAFNNAVSSAKKVEAGLKTEWEAILRLECLIGVFAVDDDSRAGAISDCKNRDYSSRVAEMSLKYPSPPAGPSCSLPADAAGSDAYAKAQYNSLPAKAPAKSCVASCCGALVVVKSAGAEDGWSGSFTVNGQQLSIPTGRGMNVVVMNLDGSVKASQWFDTCNNGEVGGRKSSDLVVYLNGIAAGTPVLVSVFDEAQAALTEEARKAIMRLGAYQITNIEYRSSYALIGFQGGFALAEEMRKRGTGAVTVSARLLPPPAGPVNLQVQSCGADDGWVSRFWVNGKQLFVPTTRGFNVVILNSNGGYVDSEVHDTYNGGGDNPASKRRSSDALVSFLASIGSDKVVLFSVSDEASQALTAAAKAAIKSFGATSLLDKLGMRDSYALIGRKGAPALAEGYKTRYTGSVTISASFASR